MLKRIAFYLVWLVLAVPAWAQQSATKSYRGLPVSISLFTESISLPGFRGIFANPGIKVGTEFYYRNRTRSQLLQTVNAGYYYHRNLHHGMFINSEFTYRRYFGNFYAEGGIGGGYLHLYSLIPMYEKNGDSYSKASPHVHKFMPSLGGGVGYRCGKALIGVRYEVFGEFPVLSNEVPLLPHKALCLSVRFNMPSSGAGR